MSRKRRYFRKEMKKTALEDTGFRCSICKTELDMVLAEAHHITPVSKGGRTVKKNLQILCRECHVNVHQKMICLVKKDLSTRKTPKQENKEVVL